MKKLLLLFFLALIILMVISGCKNNQPLDTENPNQNSNNQQNIESPHQPPTSDIDEKNQQQKKQSDIPDTQDPTHADEPPKKNSILYRYYLMRNDGSGFQSPYATMCTDMDDLANYTELLSSGYDLGDETSKWEFIGFTQKYNDEFFDNSSVLFILIDESQSNISHAVESVRKVGKQLIIDIVRIDKPEENTGSAQYNIAIEISNEYSQASEYIINIL